MPQMFLRTALTERRIEHLERLVARIVEHLGLEVPSEPDDFDNFPPQSARHPPSAPASGATNELPILPPKQSKIAQKVAKAKG